MPTDCKTCNTPDAVIAGYCTHCGAVLCGHCGKLLCGTTDTPRCECGYAGVYDYNAKRHTVAEDTITGRNVASMIRLARRARKIADEVEQLHIDDDSAAPLVAVRGILHTIENHLDHVHAEIGDARKYGRLL